MATLQVATGGANDSASQTPFFGCKISLISKSEIRYEGVLYTIDPKESTIALAKVRSFGSEDRPVERHVPPRDDIFEFIIFRASDVKDLIVDDPPQASVLSDPAILTVTAANGVESSTAASKGTSKVPLNVSAVSSSSSKLTDGVMAHGGAKPKATSSKPKSSSKPKTSPRSKTSSKSTNVQGNTNNNQTQPKSQKSQVSGGGSSHKKQSLNNNNNGAQRSNNFINNKRSFINEQHVQNGNQQRQGGGRFGRGGQPAYSHPQQLHHQFGPSPRHAPFGFVRRDRSFGSQAMAFNNHGQQRNNAIRGGGGRQARSTSRSNVFTRQFINTNNTNQRRGGARSGSGGRGPFGVATQRTGRSNTPQPRSIGAGGARQASFSSGRQRSFNGISAFGGPAGNARRNNAGSRAAPRSGSNTRRGSTKEHNKDNKVVPKFAPLPEGDFDFEKAQEDFKTLEEKLKACKISAESADNAESGAAAVATATDSGPDSTEPSSATKTSSPSETPVDSEEVVPGIPASAISAAILEKEEQELPKEPCYDKVKSFFDNISCEASNTGINRVDWKAERKLNRETFGIASIRRPNFFRNFHRGGPGAGQMRSRGPNPVKVH